MTKYQLKERLEHTAFNLRPSGDDKISTLKMSHAGNLSPAARSMLEELESELNAGHVEKPRQVNEPSHLRPLTASVFRFSELCPLKSCPTLNRSTRRRD